MKTIGITTTIPLEILIARGFKVVDLNNIFITSKDYKEYIDIAERQGFPKSLCAFIKGIYGACIKNNIRDVVGVIGGDCSNTKSLIDILKMNNINIHEFSYPHNRKLEEVKDSIDKFMLSFNLTIKEVEETRIQLNKVRSLVREIDELTYIESKASGFENHLFQVSMSDFNGDFKSYETLLREKILEIKGRKPMEKKLRLGFIGVPPMTSDIYNFVEDFDAHFVYNEVQREFSFPRFDKVSSIYEQYYDYTYPYDMDFRLSHIKKEIRNRQVDGIIHYTQSFCHRALEDIVVKKELDIPTLNIEGDKLNTLDARTKLRIESFLDMLLDEKEFKI